MTRSLALAGKLSKQYEVQFVLDTESCVNQWSQILGQKGFSAEAVSSVRESGSSGVVFDGYHFQSSDLAAEKDAGSLVVVIADNRDNYHLADLIVRPSVNDADDQQDTRVLSGCRYALLAEEFEDASVSNFTAEVKNVLVMCGAFDSQNLSEQILQALLDVEFVGSATVLLGAGAPHLDRITRFKDKEVLPFSVSVATNAIDTFHYLARSDLVIGTGGQGLIERMALGIPSVTLVASENQLDQAKFMAGHGATEVIDNQTGFQKVLLSSRLNEILTSNRKRKDMSVCARALIDGRGANRVVERALQLTRRVRP